MTVIAPILYSELHAQKYEQRPRINNAAGVNHSGGSHLVRPHRPDIRLKFRNSWQTMSRSSKAGRQTTTLLGKTALI